MLANFLLTLAEAATPTSALVAAGTAADAAPKVTNWLGFLGHFHPLLLHLPIGLVTGVIFLEMAALWRAYHHGKRSGKVEWFEESRPYVGLGVWLMAGSGVAAAAAGYMWRLDGWSEASTPELHDHQVLGFWMAGGCVLAAVLHAVAVRLRSRSMLWFFRAVLAATAVLLAPLGHLGGQMVHGNTFLSENAPAWLPHFAKDLLGKPKEKAAMTQVKNGAVAAQEDPSAFGVVVKPIIDARCISCHGVDKQKGQLQLDTLAGLIKGGANTKEGMFVAGKPEDSALFNAIHAPLDDEDHMPPKAKPQPSADEIEAIKWWIASGAKSEGKFDLAGAPEVVKKALAGLPKADGAKEEHEVKTAGADAPMVDLKAVTALRAKQVAVQPLAQGSNLLWVDFAAPAATTTDAELALLAPLARNVAQLDLGRTKITDAGVKALAGMEHLESLDLRGTAITDAGLAQVLAIKSLSSLNLVGTKVTDAGIEKLTALPALKKVYLWGTPTSAAGIAKLTAALPKVVVDNGTTPPAAVLPDVPPAVNTLCPVSGKPVNAAITSTFAGQTIAFCCADCKAKFDVALPKPAEAKPAAVAGPVNKVCPVSGKPVDPAAPTVVFEGKTIGFCCGNCPKVFQADPAKYKNNIK